MGATSGKLGNSGAAETFQPSVLQCPVQVSHKDDDNVVDMIRLVQEDMMMMIET